MTERCRNSSHFRAEVIIEGSRGQRRNLRKGDPRLRARAVLRAKSKVNDLRDRSLVTFVKKLDPLTRFIPRVLHVIHMNAGGSRAC